MMKVLIFHGQNGALAVKGGRELAPTINKLLGLPFALKVATRDYHPANHISFASQHSGAQAFVSTFNNLNFDNPQEAVTSRLWPDHCVQGTLGCELVPELDQSKLTHIIDKGQDPRVESYSAFGPPFRNPPVCRSNLASVLKDAGITDVFIVGLAFDYCVKFTALSAAEEGFKTFVFEESCQAVDQSPDGWDSVRKELRDAGVALLPLSSQDLAFQD